MIRSIITQSTNSGSTLFVVVVTWVCVWIRLLFFFWRWKPKTQTKDSRQTVVRNKYNKMYAVRRITKYENILSLKRFWQLASIDANRTYYTYSPEPSQPLNREPIFCSIDDAVKCVKSGKAMCGMRILIHFVSSQVNLLYIFFCVVGYQLNILITWL